MFIISLGEELSIFCQAHGVPKPKIVWFWNDAPVEDDNDGFRIYGYIVNNFMTQVHSLIYLNTLDVTPLDSPQNITQFRLVDSTTTRSGNTTYCCFLISFICKKANNGVENF